jgi:hypothetical protein
VNTIIELHDSTVAEFATRDGESTVQFRPAYLHKSKGRPGFDVGTGWVQEARLLFTGTSVDGLLPQLPCDIIDGDLTVGDERYENAIPVPLDAATPTQLRLIFDPTHTVTIRSRSVRLDLLGEPKYVEEFKP